MMPGTSLGIEISEKDLRIAAVQQVMRKLRLLYLEDVAGFTDLSGGEQRASILSIVQKHNISPGRVFLTLPRDRGIVRQLEFPAEIGENLKSAVSLQMESLCPWPLEEIYWNFTQQERQGTAKIIVTVVIIPRGNLDPWIEFFKSAKLPLSGASLCPAACAHGIQTLWPDTNATVALDCEPAYVDGLLLTTGHLTSVRQTGEDTTATAKAAIEQLLSIGRLQSPEEARLLVFGSGAGSLDEIENVRLPLDEAPPDACRRFGSIASALSGARKSGFNCNVIPAELRFRRSPLQLIPTYVLLLIALLLGSAMLLREPYQSTVYASKLEREIKSVAPQAREVSAQAAELDKLALKYRALLGNFQNKDYSLESLRELAALPNTVWLTNYGYQDGVVTISGVAPSATEVQKTLEETALFKDVQFTSSIARDPDGKERFSLKASIEVPR
jgi:Tfp pilus assembly protein PilN